MTGAVWEEMGRERAPPRLRRFPLIFSPSPPIPDAGLPDSRYALDRLEIHVKLHGRPPRWDTHALRLFLACLLTCLPIIRLSCRRRDA